MRRNAAGTAGEHGGHSDSLPLAQARLDEAREFADPSNLVFAADLRRRQRELDGRLGAARPVVEELLRQGTPATAPARRLPDPAPAPVRLDGAGVHAPSAHPDDTAAQAPTAGPSAAATQARASVEDALQAVPQPLPRLIIADDDPLVLMMLEASLSHAFDVVGIAADAEDAVELARLHQPDAALVDLEMPKGGGVAAVAGIVEASPATAIVVLSIDESDRMVRDLMQAGAIAYRRKGITQQALAESLTDAISFV